MNKIKHFIEWKKEQDLENSRTISEEIERLNRYEILREFMSEGEFFEIDEEQEYISYFNFNEEELDEQ